VKNVGLMLAAMLIATLIYWTIARTSPAHQKNRLAVIGH